VACLRARGRSWGIVAGTDRGVRVTSIGVLAAEPARNRRSLLLEVGPAMGELVWWLAGWVVVSFPVMLLIGRCIRDGAPAPVVPPVLPPDDPVDLVAADPTHARVMDVDLREPASPARPS
jgi:hypothetical protein